MNLFVLARDSKKRTRARRFFSAYCHSWSVDYAYRFKECTSCYVHSSSCRATCYHIKLWQCLFRSCPTCVASNPKTVRSKPAHGAYSERAYACEWSPCAVYYYTRRHYTIVHYASLRCAMLYYAALHSVYYITLHFITLQYPLYITLYDSDITMRYSALQYITMQDSTTQLNIRVYTCIYRQHNKLKCDTWQAYSLRYTICNTMSYSAKHSVEQWIGVQCSAVQCR